MMLGHRFLWVLLLLLAMVVVSAAKLEVEAELEDEAVFELCPSDNDSLENEGCIKIDCETIEDPEIRAKCVSNLPGAGSVVDTKLNDFNLLDKRAVSSLLNSGGSPHQLYDMKPVSIDITPGEALQYRFEINTTHPLNEDLYQVLIYITGNLCSYPTGLSNPNEYLTVYYGLNDTSMFESDTTVEELKHDHSYEVFEAGYFQATAYSNVKTNGSLYLDMLLVADEMNDANGTFTIQMGVSQSDLLFQWDNRTWISVVDTDDTTALFVTGNLSTNYDQVSEILNASSNYYTIHIFHDNQANYFENLHRSWCSIVNSDSLIPMQNTSYSFTQRGGGIKEQIYVKGLEPSTNYIAYVTQDFAHKDDGGVVFERLFFSTKEPDTCQLIFNLTFCDSVAYSVPKSSRIDLDSDYATLGALYDSYAEDAYANFSKAIAQIPCDAEGDQRYSPIVTCDDCRTSYKNWLCGVTIPRCTTGNETQYRYRDVGDSRSDHINSYIDPPVPYFEILPCIGMCYAMVRDCPADFGFDCPVDNSSIRQSYNFLDEDYSYDTCNFVGVLPSSNDGLRSAAVSKTALFISILVFLSFIMG